MPVEHRYFSKFVSRLHRNIKTTTRIVHVGMIASLAGCSASTSHGPVEPAETTSSSKIKRLKNSEPFEWRESAGVDLIGQSYLSPKCKALHLTGELRARNLETPTITSQLDNNGKGKLNVNMDLLDFRHAQLQRELYAARCEHLTATVEAKKLLRYSYKLLAAAGHQARARSYQRYNHKISNIRSHLDAGLSSGSFTEKSVSRVRSLLARQKDTQAKHDRTNALSSPPESPASLNAVESHQRLIAAQRRLESVNSKIRQTRAFKIFVEGGYLLDTSEEYFKSEDLYGLIKVSMRLSAFDPRRRALEQALLEAGNEGLFEHDAGIVDRFRDTAETNRIAVHHLAKRRASLKKQLQETLPKSLGKLSNDAKIFTKQVTAILSVINLRAELASVEAELVALRQADARLGLDNS